MDAVKVHLTVAEVFFSKTVSTFQEILAALKQY